MSNEEEKNVGTEQEISPKKSNRLLYMIIGLLVVLGGAGYAIYDRYALPNATPVTSKTQQIQTAVVNLENAVQVQQKDLQGLTNDLKQLKENAQAPAQTSNKWLAAEVRYMVKLADMNLQFRQSIPQAIVLLQLADQDIRDAKDATFDDVRKALNADIADLQGVAEVDTTGIYMRLLALNGKVDQLPLMNKPNAVPTPNPAVTATDENVSWWRKGLNKSFDTLRSLVVVRYHQSGSIPLISPEQQVYLYQNWHAMLMHAMSALMQGNVEIYRASLQQAAAWIKAYSMSDEAVVKAFSEELAQLQAINIHPDVPKLTRSLQAVEALTVS